LLAGLAGVVGGATAKDFQHVPAILGLERLGQYALRGLGHDVLELWHQGFRVDPVQVAAVEGGTRVFREALGQGGEVFTVFDTVIDLLGQFLGLGFGADFARFDQDMTNVHFVFQRGLAAAFLQQLQDDEAARRTCWLSDFTRLHGAQLTIEWRWQLSGFTPAHVTAVQGVVAVGYGNRRLGKVGTGFQAVIHRLGLGGGGIELLGVGAVGCSDQDVGQVQLFGELHLAQIGSQEVLHFLFRHLNPLSYATLTYTADDHLATDLVTRVLIGQAVVGQGGTELVDAHVVALSDGTNRLVQFFVRNTDTGTLADLQLQVLDDQAFQHLLVQHAGRRHATATLGDGLLDFLDALVQLALHDHVVIDDGHHFIQLLNRSVCRCGTQEQRAQYERAQTIRKLGLHVHDNLQCLCRGSSLPWRRSGRRVL